MDPSGSNIYINSHQDIGLNAIARNRNKALELKKPFDATSKSDNWTTDFAKTSSMRSYLSM